MAKQRGDRWWMEPRDKVGCAVVGRATRLWSDDSGRRVEAERNLLRWGVDLQGLYGSYRSELGRLGGQARAVKVNLTKSLTETITAKVGKLRPRPKVMTDGGSYAARMAAKERQRFLDAVFQATDLYQKAPTLFRDKMLLGTGVWHFHGHPLRPCFELESVLPLEILVDHVEAQAGRPRDLFRVHPVHKDDLIDRFPGYAESIETASAAVASEGESVPTPPGGSMAATHRVAMVYEAWRRPGYDADGNVVPGRHVVALDNVDEALVDEPWEDDFPFLFDHWSAPVRGFWGESAVFEIRGLEQEVNTLLQRAQAAMRRSGMPFVLAHKDADITQEKLSNEPGVILRYEGTVKPEIVVGQTVDPRILEQTWKLRQVAAEQLGTNDLQTSATRPPGVESGRALEQLSEEHAVRFETVSRAFEHAVSVGAGRQFVALAARMDAARRAAGKGPLKLKAPHTKDVIEVDWSKAGGPSEDLFITMWPVSVLPSTPSGKTAEVERWQSNQWITPARARELLEFPDIDEERSIINASSDLLDWQLAQMLDEGRPTMPERRQDLEDAAVRGTMAKLRALRDGTPADHIALLEDFLAVIDEWRAPPAAMPPGEELVAGTGAGAALPPDLPLPGPVAAMGATPAIGGLPMPMDPMMGAGGPPGGFPGLPM